MITCSNFYDNLIDTKVVTENKKLKVSTFEHTFDEGLGEVPLIIDPNIIKDDRGYFYESFNEREFNELTGCLFRPVQDNESYSKNGVLRGFHQQNGDYAQAKLVRVVKGAVWDVVVDLRPNSNTYANAGWVLLSESNKRQFYVPRGFAHGFLVVSEDAVFQYKCDNYYHKEAECGINPFSRLNNFSWDMLYDGNFDELILSEKDRNTPTFINK